MKIVICIVIWRAIIALLDAISIRQTRQVILVNLLTAGLVVVVLTGLFGERIVLQHQ